MHAQGYNYLPEQGITNGDDENIENCRGANKGDGRKRVDGSRDPAKTGKTIIAQQGDVGAGQREDGSNDDVDFAGLWKTNFQHLAATSPNAVTVPTHAEPRTATSDSDIDETDLLAPLDIERKREKWRTNTNMYRERERAKLETCEARARKRDKSIDRSRLLKPVPQQTRDAVMARLRKALGPDMLEECVCLVCDRCVPRCDATRLEDMDLEYISKLKTALGEMPKKLPEKLIADYDCTEFAPGLSNMLLSRSAVRVYTDDCMHHRWWSMICNGCDRRIKLKKMPKYAISNGFFVGRLTSDLDNLTIPERMMTQLATVFAMTRVMRGGRHRCIRSHCVVFDATPGPPVTLLPRSIQDVDCFRVALVGDFTEQQMSKVRRMHKIRQRLVSDALDFYKENNHLYEDISRGQTSLDDSGDENTDNAFFFDVPDDAGYLERGVNREQENIRGLADNVHVSEQEEMNVVERRTGLLDDTSGMSVAAVTGKGAGHSVADTFREFLVKRSNHFSQDEARTVFAKMFPHLFPFGRGHPGENRPVPVSLKKCVKHYTMISSRRFAEDETFVLVAFDRIAMQNMYTQTSFRCRRFPHLFEGYDRIDVNELENVLLSNERRRQGYRTCSNDDDTVVNRFLRTVDIASCAVWGSNGERMQCRREAFAYQTRFGQPALFITLTPNTDNSLVMAHYAGATNVESVFDLLDAKLPSNASLRQTSLGNDCISTRLFMRSVDAFIKNVLGIDPKTKKPVRLGGLFGEINAYFGMVETQGRGTLHIHFLIWLADCPRNSAEIEALISGLKGDEFCDSIKQYAQSIVSNDLPLTVEDGRCRNCGSSYSNLVGLKIDPHARQDPCDGLFSAEARRQTMEPLLVECGVCHTQFSSQHVLRQVLLEKRTLMPAWERSLSKREADLQARVEGVCRNTIQDASRIVDDRERFYACVSPEAILETAEMTTDEVTKCLLSVNFPRMHYCKADQDIFQTDHITRRIEMTPPSPMDGRMSSSSLDYMVSVLVVLLNQHWWGHTSSCFKASRATHDESCCRYRFPRDRVVEASFKASGVELPRKLAREFINGFNYVIMATFKCNHDIQILLGGTEALDRMYYACKYVTKPQKRLDSAIPIAVAALKRRQEKENMEKNAESSLPDDSIARSRKRVTSMVYSMTNRQEVAGPLAALYLNIGTCCYASANSCKLPLGDMIRQICSDGDYLCQLVVAPGRRGASGCNATAVSVLDDYIYRPLELENINVYEFVMKYYRKKSAEPQLTRFPFQQQHPLSETHCLGVREIDFVPIIVGYRLPGIVNDTTEDDKLKHVIGSLVLFKHFRSVAGLSGWPNPTKRTWIDSYNAWEGQRSDFVVEIMRNMHDFTFGRSAAAVAAANHQFQWSQDNEDAESTTSSDESLDDEIYDIECDIDTTESSDANLADMLPFDESHDDILDGNKINPAFCPSVPINTAHTKQIIEAFSDTGILDEIASGTATLSEQLDYEAEFPTLKYMKKWVQDATTDNPMTDAPPTATDPPRDTEVVELLDEALSSNAMQWNPQQRTSNTTATKKEFATVAEISQQFTLNELQHAAFRTIGSAILRRWKNAEELANEGGDIQEVLRKDQLLFYLGGEGGTGKSRVVGAVQELCCSWRRGGCLLKTALTGKAATLINGRTLAGFLLALKGSNFCSMLGLDIIVIDEVSMMYKSQLVDLDQRLRKVTRNHTVPFGGINIVLVGDFLQLPPVGAKPLYIKPWTSAKCTATDLTGYELWQKFSSVVILVESVRFESDPEWGEGCRLARLGTWSPEFVTLINSRVIPRDKESLRGTLSMNGVASTFVTPDNLTRQAINNFFVKETARCLSKGQYPVRIVADFKGKLKGLSRSDIEMVTRLPDNKFGRMAPFLDLVPGMPVQITQNVRAEKLVANGTLGTLEKIIFQPECSFRLVRDSISGTVVKVPSVPPEAVIVRIPRGPMAKPVARGVDSDLFPLFYDCEPYKATEISLPRSPNGEPRSLSVKIRQFPLVCAVGSTIYKVQGETLNAMVVTEWRSATAIANKKEQPYLLVSRVTSRDAFATLEPITPEVIAWAHPSKEAIDEENRLKLLSAKTVAEMVL